MAGAPLFAVQIEHIGSFRLRKLHPFEILADIIVCVVHISRQNLAQLIQPFLALWTVCADERVHGQHVHAVVVAEAGLLAHPVPQIRIVDDMIRTDQSGQVEGLGGCVDGNGPVFRIFAHGLGGDVLMSGECQIGPDLVGNHHAVVLSINLHGGLDLLPFPYTAAGIVRGAENGEMDVVFPDFPIHILVIHPPNAVFILLQIAQNDLPAVVLQRSGETDIGRGVQEYSLAGSRKGLQGGSNAAENAVFIADLLFGKPFHSVSRFLPGNDAVVIFVGGVKITEGRMLCPFNDGFLNGGRCGEVHVRHPHGDSGKAFLDGGFRKRDDIHRNGVLSFSVNDGSKVVFHDVSPLGRRINRIRRHPL